MIFILTFTFMILRKTTILGCADTATNACVLHMSAKCIPLQFGVYFLKAENSSCIFFVFNERGDKMTGQKFMPLHIGGSLGIYSNSLANLLFLSTRTHMYCPLSCLACHLENARQSKMYTASVKRTASAGISAGLRRPLLHVSCPDPFLFC